VFIFFFFSSRRRHTRFKCDWSSDVCSSDPLRSCRWRRWSRAARRRVWHRKCHLKRPLSSHDAAPPDPTEAPRHAGRRWPVCRWPPRPPRLSRSRSGRSGSPAQGLQASTRGGSVSRRWRELLIAHRAAPTKKTLGMQHGQCRQVVPPQLCTAHTALATCSPLRCCRARGTPGESGCQTRSVRSLEQLTSTSPTSARSLTYGRAGRASWAFAPSRHEASCKARSYECCCAN